MSGTGDIATATGAGGRSFERGGVLLVVVEPAGSGPVDSGPALKAEGRRLAHALGAELHVVTWPHEVGHDPDALAGTLADAAARIRPIAVLLADTDMSRRLAPMVAYRLGSGAVVGCSDVVALRAPQPGPAAGTAPPAEGNAASFVKPVYGGWLEREIRAAAGTVPVVTLLLDGVEEPGPAADEATMLEVLHVPAPAGPPRIRHLETLRPDAGSVDLIHARRVVGVGSGIISEGLMPTMRELAELLEGSVGATRPVVDDGHLPKDRLIGQTGRTVTPELYLALGISGSPHHVAGVRKADRVLSINRDARAPIFQFSDVGYVGDLEAVLPALVQRIKEWRDAGGNPYESR